MPDDNEKPTGTENPPSELTPTASPAPADESTNSQQGIFGKISDAVGRVAEKHGVSFKRGRGRPKKDGTPKSSDTLVDGETGAVVPASAAPALAAAVPTPVPTVSQAVFHRSIIGGAKGLLKTLAAFVKNMAGKAGMPEPWIARNMATVEPEPEALADWSESFRVVLEKHKVNTANAPEVALAINTGRLLVPYAVLILELRAEIKRRKEAEANSAGRREGEA